MRLFALVLTFSAICLAQKDGGRSLHATLALRSPEPRDAETIQVPITQAMSDVLTRFQASIQDGSSGHSEQLQKLFLSASNLASWMRPATSPVPVLSAPSEVISISLTPDMATALEGLRINAYSKMPAVGVDGAQTFSLAYATRAGLFVSSLKSQGGLFWNLAVKFAPDDLKAQIAISGVNGESVITAILGIIR